MCVFKKFYADEFFNKYLVTRKEKSIINKQTFSVLFTEAKKKVFLRNISKPRTLLSPTDVHGWMENMLNQHVLRREVKKGNLRRETSRKLERKE